MPSPGGVGGGELIFGELYQLFGSAFSVGAGRIPDVSRRQLGAWVVRLSGVFADAAGIPVPVPENSKIGLTRLRTRREAWKGRPFSHSLWSTIRQR